MFRIRRLTISSVFHFREMHIAAIFQMIARMFPYLEYLSMGMQDANALQGHDGHFDRFLDNFHNLKQFKLFYPNKVQESWVADFDNTRRLRKSQLAKPFSYAKVGSDWVMLKEGFFPEEVKQRPTITFY